MTYNFTLKLILLHFFALTFTSATLQAAEAKGNWSPLPDELKSVHLPQDLVQNVELALPASADSSKIISVVFGNKPAGFFETRDFQIEKRKIKFKFIPPSYKFPIHFLLRLQSSQKPLYFGQKKYSNLTLLALNPKHRVKGTFSFPFFFMNLEIKSSKGLSSPNQIPALFNRIGELVWASTEPIETTKKLLNGYFSYQSPQGSFLFLSRQDESQLIKIDGFGTQIKSFNFLDKNVRWPNSHAFDYDPEKNLIYYISFDCRKLSRWDDFIPLFSGPVGFFKRFLVPERTYMGSNLIAFNPDTFESHEIWNSYQDFSPSRNQSLSIESLQATDSFQDVKSVDQYKRLLENVPPYNWHNWPDQRCDVDWSHANSVKYYPGKGFLISLRNINKIVFLDLSGKLEYTVGNEESDTYHFATEENSFSMQHSAELIDDQTLLLYDNNSNFRGSIHRVRSNRVMIVKLTKPGPIENQEIFYLPLPKSQIKGSATLLKNGDIFAYTAGIPRVAGLIAEIDRKSKSITAFARVKTFSYSNTIEARPYYSIANEIWLSGFEIESKQTAISTNPDTIDQVLEYSY